MNLGRTFQVVMFLCCFSACVIPLRGASGTTNNQNNNQNNCNNNNNQDNQNGDGSNPQSDAAIDATADTGSDATCPDGAMCAGGCADLSSDPRNCGSCGHACGGREVCLSGRCESGCPDGQTFCRDRCTDIHSDPANCGSCDHACASHMNAITVCADGGCAFVCGPGHADCDLAPENGCEIDVTADPANCGRCGQGCALGEVCRDAVCALP